MKVERAIELLKGLEPNQDIIMDYYLKSDFDYLFKDSNGLEMTDEEWEMVGKYANKTLSWYQDVEEVVHFIISRRGK